MANDSYTETTHQGWFSRIGNSIKGILVGIVLIVASIILLFWNEGRSVTEAKSLEEGIAAVVSVQSDAVNASNDGKLVHMIGEARTEETLTDEEFGTSAVALKLRRHVEMYQWKEEKSSESKKNLGGSEDTTTTYSYSTKWSDDLIDSSEFKRPADHENPGSMTYPGQEYQAENIIVGAFRLSEGLIGQVSDDQALPADQSALPEDLREVAKPHGGGFYIGANPAAPKVGDLKITFEVIRPGKVSLIAKQLGDSFESFHTTVGGEINMLSMGEHSAQNMFADAQSTNSMITWGLRALGFFLMFVGFAAIFGPLSVLADVVPLFGTIVGMGTSVIAGLSAAVVSLVVIAVAWFFYRPFLSIALLAAVGGLVYLVRSRRKAVVAPVAVA